MVKTKDYTISAADENTSYKISNKKNTIYLQGIQQSDIDIKSFEIVGDNLLFSANNKEYTISNYKGIRYIKTDILGTKNKELLDIISNSMVDNTQNIIDILAKPYYNAKKLTVNGTNYNDILDYSESDYEPKGKTNIKNNKGLTINGGNGDDKITGTDFNDVIKGGAGKNTVVIKDTGFGNDTINLTKGEELTLDLTDCTDITELSDLKFRLSGKNLVITIPDDDESDRGTITLKNYTKNILKSLSFSLYNQDKITYENLTELTDNIIFDYDIQQATKKGVITTTNYNDNITINNSENKKYTINAGAGKNTVNIDNSDNFGTIIINEQKQNAVNNILLTDELINPEYKKIKNDLYIEDDNGTIILNNYYADIQNKSVWNLNINGEDINLAETLSNEPIEIIGNGKINGTDGDDIITITGKGSSTIKAGKGDDTIGYAKGNRTFYLFEGDGNDIVESGKGTDTLKFEKGTEVNASLIYDINGDKQLIVNYGTQGDSITFSKYNADKVFYYIGNKKYSIKSLIKNGNKIEFNKFLTHYDGTDYNDTIIDSYNHAQESPITIYGHDGDDYIDAHHDEVYGGNGNDYIHSIESVVYGEDGNDTIINYGSTNNNSIFAELYGENGNDIIINNKNAKTLCILGGDGNDRIENNGIVTSKYDNISKITNCINGGKGNDTITNNGSVEEIQGGDGDDIITNNGTIGTTHSSGYIYGGKGNDTIKNTASLVNTSIYGDEDNDTITNEIGASVNGIYGGDGEDIITNNGTAGYIEGGKGNDIIKTGAEASTQYIHFRAGDGNDTLYLNTSENYLNFNNININSSDCYWSDDDFYIQYNNNADSVKIKNYDPYNTDINVYISSGNYNYTNYDLSNIAKNIKNHIHYSDDANNIIISKYRNGDVYCGKGNDVVTNNNTISGNIYGEDDNDNITNNGTVSENIEGGAGKDFITNSANASVKNIYGNDGVDTITNEGTVSGNIYGGAGNDSVTNSINASVKNIYGNDGVDTITNEGTISGNILGGSDNDIITNETEASVVYIYGEDDDDTVTNKGTVSENIEGGAGKDFITNSANASVKNIYGNDGIDTITNKGTVSENIEGGAGNDIITNIGTVTGYISGGTGDDTITTTEGSSVQSIKFLPGDGNDTLYLNASVNSLIFNTEYKSFSWSGDDFVIKYNSYKDSVKIKNCDPFNENIVIKIDGKDLSEIALNYKKDVHYSDNSDNITIDKFTNGNIYCGDGDDIVINNNTISGDIYGELGADNITNNGTVNNVYGESEDNPGNDGGDTIINNGTINQSIYGGAGNDSITNNNDGTVQNIYGGAGNDNITNKGMVYGFISGGTGVNIITNDGTVNSYISGGTENNTITNNGTINGYISGGTGNNTIINNGTINKNDVYRSGNIFGSTGQNTITNNGTVEYIYGCSSNYEDTDGADIITNKGKVLQGIVGGGGDDIIHHYGSASYIEGGKGNDTIYTYENSGGTIIVFAGGDGTDTLYLNAKNNFLRLPRSSQYNTYRWNNDDLVITSKYDTQVVSIIIKNYDPTNHDKKVLISTDSLGENYDYLSHHTPQKPKSSLGSARENISALAEQISAFTTSGSSDISVNYDTNQTEDLPTIIAEYTYNDTNIQ